MSNLLALSKVFIKRNSATILTCLGSVGVVTTSVMAVKATPKALALLEKAKEEKNDSKLTRMEMVKTAGPIYIPTALVGISTIACIFGANILNKRQQAALMSAYALLDNSYKEYRAKVVELYGEEADKNITTEIAKDRYEDSEVVAEQGKLLFYDAYSGRYFTSTRDKVLIAEYEINWMVATNGAAFLNDFYELLGLPETEYGNYLGWSSWELMDMHWASWLDFEHEDFTMDDGTVCCKITMPYEPTYDFAEY